MIHIAGKYTTVRDARRIPRPPRRPAVRTARPPAHGLFLPTLTGKANCIQEWFWRELKDGGQLHAYFQREKAALPRAMRLAARLMHGFKQNPKSDFVRKASLPAKLYHRWKTVDEQFFDDDNNLRSLKRDNPDLPIYVEPRQLPSTTQRKSYGGTSNLQPPTSNTQ